MQSELSDDEVAWVKRQAALADAADRDFRWRKEAEKALEGPYMYITQPWARTAFLDGWVAALRAAHKAGENA